MLGWAAARAQERYDPIRVLVVVGGHGFEEGPFWEMWDAMEGIEYEALVQPAANERFEEGLEDLDVIVFYDLFQEITESQQAALLEAIRSGLGVVGLHHHLASWDWWYEWHQALGGHYHLAEAEVDGEVRPASTFQHDVDIEVSIADPDHPVTQGVENFTVFDEVYGGFWVAPDAHVLLTTDHPQSTQEIAWVRTEGEGRVVYIQPGHGPQVFDHPAYRTLVRNAVVWASGS